MSLHAPLTAETSKLLGAAAFERMRRGAFLVNTSRGGLVDQDALADAVGFTGSTGGGRALYDLAVGRENPIPFYGELGSINPVVVTEAVVAARGREVAEGLAGSFRLGTGQFCTKPGVVLVPADSGFDTQVADAVRPSEPAPMLTARMRDAFQAGIAALSEVPGVRELVKAEPRGRPVWP